MSGIDQLRRWLLSEEGDEASERGIASAFAALPDLSPSPAFVDTVLAELGVAPAVRSRAFESWSSRAAVAACLLLGSSVVLLLPQLPLPPVPHPSALVGLGVGAAHLAATWWGAALSVWSFFFAVGEKASLILTARQAPLALALISSALLLAFRWLVLQSRQERSTPYVETA